MVAESVSPLVAEALRLGWKVSFTRQSSVHFCSAGLSSGKRVRDVCYDRAGREYRFNGKGWSRR